MINSDRKRITLIIGLVILFIISSGLLATQDFDTSYDDLGIVETPQILKEMGLSGTAEAVSQTEVLTITISANASGTEDTVNTYTTSRTAIFWNIKFALANYDDVKYFGFFLEWSDSDTIAWRRNAAASLTITIVVNIIEFHENTGVEVTMLDGMNPTTSIQYQNIGDTYTLGEYFVTSGSVDDDVDNHHETQGYCYPYSSTQIAYRLMSTTDDCNEVWAQVVYVPDSFVQTGDTSIPLNLDNTVDIPSAVNWSMSSVFMMYRFTDYNPTANGHEGIQLYSITDTDTFVVRAGTADTARYCRWQVVEWPSWVDTVQRNGDYMGTADTSEYVTVSSFDVDHALVLTEAGWAGHMHQGGWSNSAEDDYDMLYTIHISSATSVGVTRSSSGSNCAWRYSIIVIEFGEVFVNDAPVNDLPPSLDGDGDTTFRVLGLETYSIGVFVSDVNGYADISFVTLTYETIAYVTQFTIKYDQDTDTFSEVVDGANVVVLDVGASSATGSGNDLDITFVLTINLNYPDTRNYPDQYVEDSEAASDTDDWSHTPYMDVETRLSIDNEVLTDGLGTTDRGNYDAIDTINVSGKVSYYAGATINYPNSSLIDVWIICTDIAGGPWQATNYESTGGTFSVTVDSDDIVGLDTYSLKIVKEGDGSTGTDIAQSTDSLTYIADRAQVQSYTVVDTRVDVNVNVDVDILLWYDYDNSQVTDGTVTINGYSASHQGSGVWRITRTSSSVTGITYDTVASSGNAHGITIVDQNSQSETVIWDRAQVQSYTVVDTRVDVNVNVDVDILLWYDYDNSQVTDGTVTINGYSASHQGSGVWRITRTSSSVTGITYDTVASSGNAHGITIVDQNSQSETVIWDRAQVQSYTVVDTRVDVNVNVDVDILLWYDYDNSQVTDGTVTINGYSASHQGSGVWRITRTSSSVTGITYDTVASSGNAHGITIVDQNSQSETVIWDRAQVQSYTVVDTRVDVNVNVDVDILLWYDYDNSQVTDGTVTINGYSASHQGSGVWRITRTSSSVTGITYDTVASSGNAHGITIVDQNSQSETVIWDRAQVQSYTVVDTRVDVNVNVDVDILLWYDYDNSQVTDGTVTINGYSASHQGSGVWRITRTSSSVTGITYDTVASSGNAHGITIVDQNSQSETVIWDRAQVQSYTVVDTRVDVNVNVDVDILLWYDYDNSQVTDGTVTINGYSASHQGSGVWRITRTSSSVTGITYDTVASSGNAHGITIVDQNSQSETVIWDRIYIYDMWVDELRVSVNENATVHACLVSEYDNQTIYEGIVQVNGTLGTLVAGDYNLTLESDTFLAFTGAYYGGSSSGSYSDTWIMTGSYSAYESYATWVRVDVNVTNAVYKTNLDVDIYWGSDQLNDYPLGTIWLTIWDWQTGSYDSLSSKSIEGNYWHNFTISTSDWISSTGIVRIRAFVQYDGSNPGVRAYLHYVNIDSDTGVGTWVKDYNYGTVGIKYFLITYANWTTHNITEINYNGWNVTLLSVIWERVLITLNPNYQWSIISYNITMDATGVYESDNSAWSGTVSFNSTWTASFYPNQDTVGNYTYTVTSISGIVQVFVVHNPELSWCIFDSAYATTSISKYWSQYSETEVNLVWGEGSYWKLSHNETWLTYHYSLHAYSNGSSPTALGGIYGTGAFGGMSIGFFNPTWYYVNITVNCEVTIGARTFDWLIWDQVLSVDVLHSLQIVSWSIVPTDYSFWIQYQTNLLNASIIAWDDAIDSGTLFSNNIYYSIYEGMHNIPRSTIIGAHNLTLCITSTGVQYDKDFTVDYYVWWYNFTYVVQEPTSYDCHIVILNNLYELIQFDTFEVYKNGSRIYHNIIQVVDGYNYNITVKNRFGDTVNSTIFSDDYEMVIFVNTYSFKFMNWYQGFLRVNVTRAGVTYSEIIMPTEILEFNLFEATYIFSVDFLNGTTKFSQEITVTNSTGYVITGDSLTNVFDLVNSLYEMTTEINITVTATNNYVYTISIDLSNINTTINEQLVYVLLNITNTNSVIGEQTIDLLAYLQNINSTIYNQTVDMLIELNYISSNVTANFISVSATLSALDSNLLSNFTSVSAALVLIDSNLLSNFTEVTATLSAIGSNVTANYLSVAATLSALDSNLLSNFTSVSAALVLIDSNLLSNFTEVTATLSAIGSNVTANYLSVAATLSALDSNLLSNFTSVSAALVLIDSNLLSNFTEVTATLSAIGSNVTANYLSITAELALIDSSLAANFTLIVSKLVATNSSIVTQTLTIISNLADLNATLQLIHDPTELHLWIAGHNLGDIFCDFTLRSTWNNATLIVFDNNVQQTVPVAEGSTLRYALLTTLGQHNLSVLINATGSWIWYNITYTNAIPTTTTGEMIFAFRTTSGLDIGFYTVNVSISYGSTTVILADRVILVPIAQTFNITIKNLWGVVIYSETNFNYSSHKWIILPLYEFYIDNDSEHLVTVKFSYQQTYDNITFIVPRGGRIILLDPAVYRIVFTYYSNHTGSGQLINYFAQTPYYVAYVMNITGNGGLQYTGIGFWDLQQNLIGVEGAVGANYDQIMQVYANLPETPVIPDTSETTADAVTDTQANMITFALTLLVGFTVIAILAVIGAFIWRGIKNDESKKAKRSDTDTDSEEEGDTVWRA